MFKIVRNITIEKKKMRFYKIKIKSNRLKMFSLKFSFFLRMKKVKN